MDKDFLDCNCAFHVHKSQMNEFLKECEDNGLIWHHGPKPTEFNPIEFYGADDFKYYLPIDSVDSPDYVYVKAFFGKMHFQFHLDWVVAHNKDYKSETVREVLLNGNCC